MTKKRIVVIVGSGFPAAVTGGCSPMIGNNPVPTLAGLADAMLAHLDEVVSDLPFPSDVIAEARDALGRNQELPAEQRLDFEQLLSLVAIKAGFATVADVSQSRMHRMSEVLKLLIYLIPSLFAARLAMNGKLTENRNLFYSVKDVARVKAFQAGIRDLVDRFDVTFISFNYDGLVEAFLDCDLGVGAEGQQITFRYFPEISHGFRMAMPEYVFGGDTRNFARFDKVPRVLKPHGSMHFYRMQESMRILSNGPQMVALHPRFDLNFNPATMQRDIPNVKFWEFAEPIPFIIPPVFNKDSFLSQNYARVVFGQAETALANAEAIVSLGFSIPRSDLHVNALLEYAVRGDAAHPKIALAYSDGPNDKTLPNWKRVCRTAAITELFTSGLPVDTVDAVTKAWGTIAKWCNEA